MTFTKVAATLLLSLHCHIQPQVIIEIYDNLANHHAGFLIITCVIILKVIIH